MLDTLTSGWEINPRRTQAPTRLCKYLGVRWCGGMKEHALRHQEHIGELMERVP